MTSNRKKDMAIAVICSLSVLFMLIGSYVLSGNIFDLILVIMLLMYAFKYLVIKPKE